MAGCEASHVFLCKLLTIEISVALAMLAQWASRLEMDPEYQEQGIAHKIKDLAYIAHHW